MNKYFIAMGVLNMSESKKTVIDIVVEQIMDRALTEKKMPYMRNWQKNASVNWNTCREYTGINRFLLNAGEYLTFIQAKKNGFTVNKGAKSSIIVRKIEGTYALDNEGLERVLNYVKQAFRHRLKGSNPSQNVLIDIALKSNILKRGKDGELRGVKSGLKYYRVFNIKDISDKDGNPVKTREEKGDIIFEPMGLPEEIAVNYLESEGIQVHYGATDAVYKITSDTILLPDENKFKSRERYYSTLFHLIAHSTGRDGRLDREVTADNMLSTEFSLEELTANFAASMLCAETGIYDYQPDVINNDVAYIQEWYKVLREEPNMLTQATSTAERIKRYVLQYSVDEETLDLNTGDENTN